MIETNYTDQYVAFCQRANLPINEVPNTANSGVKDFNLIFFY